MANLIRLKQIESGSQLQTSAEVGADFSASVNNIVSQSIETTFSASIVQIITNNVGAVLPDGVISSSTQVNLVSASGYTDLATDIEVAFISNSLGLRLYSLEQFSASLDQTFATDVEVSASQSQIHIDMGEF